MRKYYLFIIKNDYYKMYKKNSSVLYKTLFNLYNIKTSNLTYGLSLYDNLCNINSKKLLVNYIKKKYKYEMFSSKIIKLDLDDENTFIQVNYSCIIIVSSNNFPTIFKILNIYNKRIFVCDFKNNDYFWLNDQINKLK